MSTQDKILSIYVSKKKLRHAFKMLNENQEIFVISFLFIGNLYVINQGVNDLIISFEYEIVRINGYLRVGKDNYLVGSIIFAFIVKNI
ncbi:MAG: hypothetical protein ACFFB5_04640 [Promethearchaeota archaeon]